MTSEIPPQSTREQNDVVRRAWDANAAFWDERMGEGNDWHLQLVAPATERLLEVQPGQRILDAACGNGQFDRRLAELGAEVVAFDQAPALIERARAHQTPFSSRIRFAVADATDAASMRALGGGPFDAVVCNQALMDIADVEPLLTVAREVLKPDGRFVFTLQHPCFVSNYTSLQAERGVDGSMEYTLKLRGYKQPRVDYGIAMLGQPEQQLYFHRSLEDLFGAFFKAGFVLDALLEPAFDQPPPGGTTGPNWANLWRIPPSMCGRMRPR
jgi:2-polyprenyl-3-methyl-5-hydroxy-6-metoxy-1,4-benzoquinol methylase